MVYALVGILGIFIIYLIFETNYKAQRIIQSVNTEKRNIADDSGMTANVGVFTPDTQTTVIIGVSEEIKAFYYRMLRNYKVQLRRKTHLGCIIRAEFLLNSIPYHLDFNSNQPTASLRARDIADNAISNFDQDTIRQIGRASMRIYFQDDSGAEKVLEITTLRSTDERHKLERVQLLRHTIWWVAFLLMTSRQARHTNGIAFNNL